MRDTKAGLMEWYIRIKVKMEDNYRLFNRLVPVKGQITDIGCGFGPLCYMLSQLSEEREITGIDYDEDKIAVAQYGWLRTPRQTVHSSPAHRRGSPLCLRWLRIPDRPVRCL